MNAELSPDDRFYEWLLSDHPAAVSERTRRRLNNQLVEAIDLARLQGWLAKIDRLAKDGRPLGDSVWGLANQTRTRLIPDTEQRLAALTDPPDHVRVHQARLQFETSRQVGKDPDYRYPVHYLGAQAARQPIPPEPWARPHDPEEAPTLSDRTVKDLEAENSRLGFVRTQAISHRARLARERADRNRPACQPRDDAPACGPIEAGVTVRSPTVNAELARLLREGRWVQPTSAAGVLGIGAAAFLLSYDALHSLALASGVRPGLARIWPGVLDGFIVVATLTVVAAKRASRPTWYPWALVVLFSAASVAFNILHAIDQGLASAGWIAALVFAMPPVALVLATHLLLQQGVWRRQNTRTATAAGEAASKGGTSPPADAMARPAAVRPRRRPEPAPAAVEGAGRPSAPAVQPPSAPGDAATRDRARQLYVEAQATGRRLTGADLGRALGTSDSYGRLLLREFRTNHPAPGNGSSREA